MLFFDTANMINAVDESTECALAMAVRFIVILYSLSLDLRHTGHA